MVSYFLEKRFPAVRGDVISPLSLFRIWNVLCASFIVFSFFTSRASCNFLCTCLVLQWLFLGNFSWIVHDIFWCVQWRWITPSYLSSCCLADVPCNVSKFFSLIRQYIHYCMNSPSGTLQDDYKVVALVCFDIESSSKFHKFCKSLLHVQL